MKQYTAYFFDLYGTLVDIHTDEGSPAFWDKIAAFYSEKGASYTGEELRRHYHFYIKALECALLPLPQAESSGDASPMSDDASQIFPEIQLEDVFSHLYKRKGIPVTDALISDTALYFRETSRSKFKCYAGADFLLKSLLDSGKEIYLLSNAQRIFTEKELKDLGLFDLFDKIFISSDYGCKKPDKRFFEKALEETGLEPEECLMIGNDPHDDMEGALSVGMDGFYIHSSLSPKYTGLEECTYRQMGMGLKKLSKKLLG